MSRTTKDVPYWVRVERDGVLEHDHRRGTCVIEHPEHPSGTYIHGRHGHVAKCEHYEPYVRFCTPEEAANRSRYSSLRCLQPRYVTVWTPAGPRDVRRGTHPCDGHDRWYYNPDSACRCDDFPTPTCSKYEHVGEPRRWYTDPSSDVNLYDRRPIRRAARTQLETTRRRYNAGDNLDDWDYIERSPWRGSW